MPRYNNNTIQDYLNRSDNAPNSDAKGDIFEDLVIYLFTHCKGVRLEGRNILDETGARELDIAFWNNRSISSFDFLDPIIICECKNVAKPLGSDKVRDFVIKLKTSGANNGILVSSSGISGQARRNRNAKFATSVIIDALIMDRIKIIVISRAEILALATTDDLSNLISEKFSQLTLRRAVE